MEGDAIVIIFIVTAGDFNPLPPHGGRLYKRPTIYKTFLISIHSLRMEGDQMRLVTRISDMQFQSTPSAWRETCVSQDLYSPRISFQSTPSAWRETSRDSALLMLSAISIHSLRMEGDVPMSSAVKALVNVFQSTPSAWRETQKNLLFRLRSSISIHSLRMEGDETSAAACTDSFPFQSTPSAWRETAKLHRKAFFISPILVQSCKKGCKRLHSAPEKMVFFEKREKNLVRNLQHLSVRL